MLPVCYEAPPLAYPTLKDSYLTTDLTSKGRVLPVASVVVALQDQLITGQNMGFDGRLSGGLKTF